MFVVVGLGNPGKDYVGTRHNVGFDTIDLLSKRHSVDLNKIKFKSVYGEVNIKGEKVLLVKPQTYMNNSGEAVREIMDFYKLEMENIIVVVDDIDIDYGTVRVKGKGSAGSHNGLKSIISHTRSQKFPRIKIGIGKKHEKQDLASFVLGRFSKEERLDMDQAILNSAKAVETIIEYDINRAMNEFNNK